MDHRLTGRLPSVVSLAIFLCLLSVTAWADTKIIIAEGSYTMGDGETPTVAEARALHNAKRMAVEQAGTYLQSYTKTKNFQLTNDELEMVAGALVEIEVLEKKRTVVGEGIRFSVKIKATVTPDKADALVARLKQKGTEPGLNQIQQFKDLQGSYDRLSKEMEDLKLRYAQASSGAQKERAATEIARNELAFTVLFHGLRAYLLSEEGEKQNLGEAILSLSQAIEELKRSAQQGVHIKDRELELEIYQMRGWIFAKQARYEQAVSDLSEAIKLHPGKAKNYILRGVSYHAIEQYKQAVSDLTEAIKIGIPDEETATVYGARGSAYLQLRQNDEAIFDLTKVIQLSPTSLRDPLMAFRALYERGFAYMYQKQLDLAVADFTHALKFSEASMLQDRGLVLLFRGQAYHKLGQTSAAIADFTEVISLKERAKDNNALLAQAYAERGMEHVLLKRTALAISDFNAAIRLDPKNGTAYFGRGVAYLLNSSEEKLPGDFKQSCDLGYDPACQFLIQRR